MIYGTPPSVFIAARKRAMSLGLEAEHMKTGGMRMRVIEIQQAFPTAGDNWAKEMADFLNQGHSSGEWQIGVAGREWASFYFAPKANLAANP